MKWDDTLVALMWPLALLIIAGCVLYSLLYQSPLAYP